MKLALRPKTIKYSNGMGDTYKIINEYNLGNTKQTSIVFDDMIVCMISNEYLNPVVTELFIRG